MTAPKVSVFSTVKNGARFLVDTIESIRAQTFLDYEIVIVDGNSSDGTVEILKRYPEIRWLSEPDNSAEEGFHKALRMCRGEYLFQCCVSDGFLDKRWFEICVGILDKDPDVSLVYGVQQNMTEEGELKDIVYRELLLNPPPQKEDFFPFWLATRFHFPETNYCVRRNVFLKCFPSQESQDYFDRNNPFLKCVFAFNMEGYLPYFVPVVANYFKTHGQQLTETKQIQGHNTVNIYHAMIADYGQSVFKSERRHLFRNGGGEVIGRVDGVSLEKCRKAVLKHVSSRTMYLSEKAESVFSIVKISPVHRLLVIFFAKFNTLLLRSYLRFSTNRLPVSDIRN